jgi:Uma2 family endonuclease
MTSLTISLDSVVELTDEQFYKLCQTNRELRFERSPSGELTVMSPAGSETGNRNAGIIAQLWVWNELSNQGVVFDSSTGFRLPNGADRSPDAAWVKLERWTALSRDQQQEFAPICPDFVVELMSPNDNLIAVRLKLQEYLDNGIRLGWLINRETQTVEIYRSARPVELLNQPTALSGEDILIDFTLKMEKIW